MRHVAHRLLRDLAPYLPPAIRPGLHCGMSLIGFCVISPLTFPRPSGRGSIAAMRNGVVSQRPPLLPPAIRPGLHCGKDIIQATKAGAGAFPRPSGRGSIAASRAGRRAPTARALPPAIRPGLHCGADQLDDYPTGHWSSPGHQAGAPLRLVRAGHRTTAGATSPGHQAGAPLRLLPRVDRQRHTPAFPRPSGRGSIAARCFRADASASPSQLPPAIRPGLHCGTNSAWRSAALQVPLPPAIRPGLHCGDAIHNAQLRRSTNFPRPSGRGSIAANSCRACHQLTAALPPAIRPGLHCGWEMIFETRIDRPPSPGHQAGAPLRPRSWARSHL